jgi:prepilin-type N-terminal cleavage/methylation domain-containing protein
MPTSASCPPPKPRGRNNPPAAAAGFTLLELLVVLAILGLASAVALPQLSTVAARIEFALNRERFERALALLPYEAYRRREDLVVGQAPAAAADGSARAALPLREGADRARVEPPVLSRMAELPIPADWRVEAPQPIYFRATGFCSGGNVVVRVGGEAFTYDLRPPQCLPVLK